MLKKLLNGELPLGATFWKFGILGVIFFNVFLKIFGSLLAQKLKGVSVYNYYTKYFNPINLETSTVVYTACYLATIFLFIAYSSILVPGVWRSSAEYDRSLWLRHLSRIIILLLIYITLRPVF